MSVVAIQRVRLRFRRAGEGVKLSHLHQIDALRRAFVDAKWPVSTAHGKKHKVRASFGPAVSVGLESDCEYCDLELESRLDPKTAPAAIQPFLPAGYELMSLKSIPRFFPSLDQTLNGVAYEITSPLLAGTEPKWAHFWSQPNYIVTKKKESGDVAIDARACVVSWKLEGDILNLMLRFGPGRTLKPERIIQAVCGLEESQVDIGAATSPLRVKRKQLYMERQDGSFVEP
jgi:radical SAM-linked protein